MVSYFSGKKTGFYNKAVKFVIKPRNLVFVILKGKKHAHDRLKSSF